MIDVKAHGFNLAQSTILAVDDEPEIIAILQRMLGQAGFDGVVGTSDAASARELFQQQEPDLVLLDLRLPDVDGYELLEELRGAEGFVPVIVLTADTSDDAKRRCLESGASDFLTKPFDKAEVVLRIRNLLSLRRLQVETRTRAASLEQLVAERTTELTRTVGDLRRMDDQRQQLLARLIDAQEQERQRMAADLHDDPIQKVTALAIKLESVLPRLDGSPARESIEQAVEMAHTTISRLRSLLLLLRPRSLDESGLVQALSELLDRVGPNICVHHRLRGALVAEPTIPVRAAAYRIAQEAIANIGKHAKATAITVSLQSQDGGIYVCIEDDGIGPPAELGPEHGHLGLTSMHQRAQMLGGWWRFGPAEKRGSRVEYWIPDGIDVGAPPLSDEMTAVGRNIASRRATAVPPHDDATRRLSESNV